MKKNKATLSHTLWRTLAIFPLISFFASCASFHKGPGPDDSGDAAPVIQQLLPHVVTVDIELTFSHGQPPLIPNLTPASSSDGTYSPDPDGETLVREHRPLETIGYLMTSNDVLLRDVGIASRFIRGITVSQGTNHSPAHIRSVAKDQDAMLVTLDQPLPSAQPVTFVTNPVSEDTLFAFTSELLDGEWQFALEAFSPYTYVSMTGAVSKVPAPPGLVVTPHGDAVGVSAELHPASESSWIGNPLKTWTFIDQRSLDKQLEALTALCADGLPHVSVTFRSPRQKEGSPAYNYENTAANSVGTATELDTIGIIYATNRILVLLNLPPESTTRMEDIRIHMPDRVAPATFVASLREYGAFVAAFDPNPAPACSWLTHCDLTTLCHSLLLTANVRVAGQQKIVEPSLARVYGLMTGNHGILFPTTGFDDNQPQFGFTPDLHLLFFPLQVRDRFASTTRTTWDSPNRTVLMPVAAAQTMLANLEPNADRFNRPLSEADENRLGWLGVVMQKLSPELARDNACSDQTEGGSSGGLVTFVYPDSPAAQAGIDSGTILLRLHIPEEPRPTPVMTDDDTRGPSFDWSQIDQVPAEYFSEIPLPWPDMDNAFNRMLTDVGAGTALTMDLIQNGIETNVTLSIGECPPHYQAAARFKSKLLGVTVRDLTFEVRLFMQKDAGDPGVVVSKVEAGQTGAVAGLTPYELITHVDGVPVFTAAAFEKAIQGKAECVLSVQRMANTRQVRVRLKEPDSASNP